MIEDMMEADAFFPGRPTLVMIRELGLAVLVAVVTFPLGLSAFVSAAICTSLLPLFRCMRTGQYRPSYRRDPGSCRVAIVGAGWSGLAIAARMRELGVAFQGFEAEDDVGGTWHPQRSYAGLQLHTPAYGASFAHFPYGGGADDKCPDGRAVHAYLRRFANAMDLSGCFVFGARVRGLTYDAHTRTASVEVERSGRFEDWGAFDLVVFASVAAHRYMPSLPGTFHGALWHASEASTFKVAALGSDAGRRVVIVGAGKSACDLVLALVAAGVPPHRLIWLARRPYYFYKFERIFHRTSSTACDAARPCCAAPRRWLARLAGMLRGLGAALAMGLCLLSPRLGWRLLWALDFIYTPFGPRPEHTPGAPSRWHQWSAAPAFHMGILNAAQRRVLAEEHGRYTLVLGDEPVAYGGDAIVLRSGGRVECEVVIWASGFETGVSDLRLSKSAPARASPRQACNGRSSNSRACGAGTTGEGAAARAVDLAALASVDPPILRSYRDEEEARLDGKGVRPYVLSDAEPLFEHVLCPSLPALALPAHFFVGPGPEGAREAAEYLVYHLCVRPPLSEATMAAEASAQWCHQPVRRHLLFGDAFWSSMMLVQMDLINAGVLPMATALRRLVDFWMFNVLPPRELGLLPAAAAAKAEAPRREGTSGGMEQPLRSHDNV